MIEIIFKRRPIREFLKKYPSDKWKEIIPDVLEIGVLNLKNSFNTLMFSKEDFNNILFDLRSFKPQKPITPKTKKAKKNNEPKVKHHSPTYEDEDISYTSEEETFTKEYDDSMSYIPKKPTLAKAEVYIPDENEIKRRNMSNSKNRPRKGYYTTQDEIREQNRENQRNLAYAESKIRAQILNDKMIHKAMKSGIPQNENTVPMSNKGINYAINYDKNLAPESIKKVEKEPMYYYSNSNVANNNISNTSRREVRDENSNYYNNYNNESDLDNNGNNLNYNYISNSDLNNSGTNNVNNNTNNNYYDNSNANISAQTNKMNVLENPQLIKDSVVTSSPNSNRVNMIPVLNSLNTVETANFNNDNNNSKNYYTPNLNNINMNSNIKSFQSSNMNLYQENNQEVNKVNEGNLSENEEELSMCNLSQRTKSIYYLLTIYSAI